jgi:hypothetical protein
MATGEGLGIELAEYVVVLFFDVLSDYGGLAAVAVIVG